MLTVKIDPRMKAALKKAAAKQFISTSAAAKQAIEKYLEVHGIDWRKQDVGGGKKMKSGKPDTA